MGEEKLKCFDVAYLEQITDELLHYKVEPKTIYRGVSIDDFISAVGRLRESQKQWGEGDPFDCTEVELAKRMQESEREVDEYLKKFNENI